MSTKDLEQELRRHALPLTAEEFLAAAIEGLRAAPPTTTATQSELEFLREHGGPGAEVLDDPTVVATAQRDQAQVAVRTLSTALADSYDVGEVAALLNLDKSSVTRRIQRNALWSFIVDGKHRIPKWQFVGRTVLPGLDVVLRALPGGLPPMALATAMRTEREELAGASPAAHLAAAGNAAEVVDVLAELARW